MKTILLVEDDPLIVHVYRKPLENSGYRVEVAGDGLAAMKMLLGLKPDVVALDIMMPKVDGTYVLKYIRSEAALKATKVILLSNASIADAAKDAIALNPERVFLKSQCTPKILLAAVRELLGDGDSTPPVPLPPG